MGLNFIDILKIVRDNQNKNNQINKINNQAGKIIIKIQSTIDAVIRITKCNPKQVLSKLNYMEQNGYIWTQCGHYISYLDKKGKEYLENYKIKIKE